MTKNFDSLLESLLTELVPADISGFEGGMGGAAQHIGKNIPQGEPKGHWSPLQKLSPEDRDKVIQEIIREVFTDNENTYAPTVDSADELHSSIASAIQKVSGRTGLKAAGNWAAKFLADRLMTLLKSTVKYTTAGGEELQKDMTQKEFKQALNNALKEAPTPEEAPAAETPEEPQAEPQAEEDLDVEKVYTKAADLDSDDTDLQKAFQKLPEDKELSWEEVIKMIGTTKALALLEVGGLTETEKELEAGEDEEVQALDFDEEDSADLSNFDRIIDPYFRTTKGGYELPD